MNKLIAVLILAINFQTASYSRDVLRPIAQDGVKEITVSVTDEYTSQSISKTFVASELVGDTFDRFNAIWEVPKYSTFCATDLAVKTIVVTNKYGNDTTYSSGDENCFNDEENISKRYINHIEFYDILEAFNITLNSGDED